MEAKTAAPAAKKASKQTLEQKRKTRKPMDGRKQMLAAEIPPGFVARWFLDAGSRLAEAQAAGWEFMDSGKKGLVTTVDDQGSLVRMLASRRGNPLTGDAEYLYLMCIEKELYDEDQARKLNAIVDTEKEIVRGENARTEGKIDGDLVYVKEADLRNTPL